MIEKMKIKERIRQSLAALLLIAGCSAVNAHDFTATLNGQKICFNIKSKTGRTAEVTYSGSIADKRIQETEGMVEIPARVKHNNVVYTVTGIGAKAFSGSEKLTGIILPGTVTRIGDFAFEGCTSLSKIVFPGGSVAFGEGVFFKCTSIRNVTFGSDWKQVDLKRFRWSDSLAVVNIPAKVEKISGLKSLKGLKEITVDANNSKFSSYSGALYNKVGNVLYGCPRAYKGRIEIKEGTETVTNGALIDCTGITEIDFPASIKKLSFRETSRMKELEQITFRGNSPVNTAYKGTEGKFVIQTANADVRITVLNSSKKEFKSLLVQEAGEYSETPDSNGTRYAVRAEELPKAKNIVGVKGF